MAEDPKGKEVINTSATVARMVYPAAGALIEVAGELVVLAGGLGGSLDPVVAEAISRINQRLDALESRMDAVEREVQRMRNEVFRDKNLARIRLLRRLRGDLKKVLVRLAQQPKDKDTRVALASDAQTVAEEFLADNDLWRWNDLSLKTYTWEGKRVEAGEMLDADFKSWPTMEDYTLALNTWMTAMEYASEGNRQWVKETYGAELEKHIAFLSVRPGWDENNDEPETLPENVKKRISGRFIPDKYPENRRCHFHEYIQDTMARELKYIQTMDYHTNEDNVLCTVPDGFLNRVTSAEEELEDTYGTGLMELLAQKLTNLKEWGTAREQFIGTFGKSPPNYQPLLVYVITNDGKMLWYRKDSGDAPWQGPKAVGSVWFFKNVIAAGGNSLYALTNDNKLLWYQHDGFNDGSMAWKGPVEVGSGWTYPKIFSGGEGIVYAIRGDGKLYWYKNNGAEYGVRDWQEAKEVGSEWDSFKDVFSTGEGSVYAVTPEGKLLYYHHRNYASGAKSWSTPKELSSGGWLNFRQIVPTGDGTILGILNNGSMVWYKHSFVRPKTRYGRVKATWEGPIEIGSGWTDFRKVVALIPVPSSALPGVR